MITLTDVVQARQERISRMSLAAKGHVDALERLLSSRDCWNAMDSLMRAKIALVALSEERRGAALAPEGPVGAALSRRLSALAARFSRTCLE